MKISWRTKSSYEQILDRLTHSSQDFYQNQRIKTIRVKNGADCGRSDVNTKCPQSVPLSVLSLSLSVLSLCAFLKVSLTELRCLICVMVSCLSDDRWKVTLSLLFCLFLTFSFWWFFFLVSDPNKSWHAVTELLVYHVNRFCCLMSQFLFHSDSFFSFSFILSLNSGNNLHFHHFSAAEGLNLRLWWVLPNTTLRSHPDVKNVRWLSGGKKIHL